MLSFFLGLFAGFVAGAVVVGLVVTYYFGKLLRDMWG